MSFSEYFNHINSIIEEDLKEVEEEITSFYQNDSVDNTDEK